MSEHGDEEVEDIFNCEIFINKNYWLKDVSVSDVQLQLYALHNAASTDHDLTGQIVWPAARLVGLYLAHHADLCKTASILELGAGAGLSGLVAAKLAEDPSRVVLTDYNPLVIDLMRKNVDVNFCEERRKPACDELCWGDDNLDSFIRRYGSFDLIIGADVVFWPQAVPLLFQTVQALLLNKPTAQFILGYINRANYSTKLMFEQAQRFNLQWKVVDISHPEFQSELRKHSLDERSANVLIFTLNESSGTKIDYSSERPSCNDCE